MLLTTIKVHHQLMLTSKNSNLVFGNHLVKMQQSGNHVIRSQNYVMRSDILRLTFAESKKQIRFNLKRSK